MLIDIKESLKIMRKKFIKYINSRKSFGICEFLSVIKVISYFYFLRIDPLYQSIFEEKYTNYFSKYMGGGFSDAVNSGTAACFIAINSLGLKKGSIIAVSNFTDPGVLNAIIIAGYKPLLIPFISNKNWRHDFEALRNIFSKQPIRALLIVHSFGDIVNLEKCILISKEFNVPLIEDISQCAGGEFNGRKVGTFGKISFCSTMGRKNFISGSSGGIVFTKNEKIFKKIKSFADRGKFVNENFEVIKNAPLNTEISLNFSSNEISAAIAYSSLKRIDKVIKKRRKVLHLFKKYFSFYNLNSIISLEEYSTECAPFVGILNLNSNLSKERKIKIKILIESLELPINTKYDQIASSWQWLKNHLISDNQKAVAKDWSNNNFILYLHEGYKEFYIKSICKSLSTIIKK